MHANTQIRMAVLHDKNIFRNHMYSTICTSNLSSNNYIYLQFNQIGHI